MKKILFITPRMDKGGSEVALFHIINHIKNFQCFVYSEKNGVLLKKLPKHIKHFIDPLQRPIDYYKNFIYKKLLKKSISQRYLEKLLVKEKFDACVLNTITTAKWIPIIKKFKLPICIMNHEMYSIYETISSEDVKNLLDKTDFIISLSGSSYEIIQKAGFNKKHYLFYEPIDSDVINVKNLNLSWNKNFSYVFGMSGVFYTRKGAYIIVELARYLKSKNSALIWLGEVWNTGLTELIKRQLKNLNLNNVFFTGELDWDIYYSYLNSIDAFLLTSIEEPYGIVCLEAMYLKKPIIAFNSGGPKEYIKNGIGRLVPLLNLKAMFQAIDDFISNKIFVDENLLRKEAEKHDIKCRINEFEKILIEGFNW